MACCAEHALPCAASCSPAPSSPSHASRQPGQLTVFLHSTGHWTYIGFAAAQPPNWAAARPAQLQGPRCIALWQRHCLPEPHDRPSCPWCCAIHLAPRTSSSYANSVHPSLVHTPSSKSSRRWLGASAATYPCQANVNTHVALAHVDADITPVPSLLYPLDTVPNACRGGPPCLHCLPSATCCPAATPQHWLHVYQGAARHTLETRAASDQPAHHRQGAAGLAPVVSGNACGVAANRYGMKPALQQLHQALCIAATPKAHARLAQMMHAASSPSHEAAANRRHHPLSLLHNHRRTFHVHAAASMPQPLHLHIMPANGMWRPARVAGCMRDVQQGN
jgi:hypothetical protein